MAEFEKYSAQQASENSHRPSLYAVKLQSLKAYLQCLPTIKLKQAYYLDSKLPKEIV